MSDLAGSEGIHVTYGADLILALLYAGGEKRTENEEIRGNTRLDKLVFLLKQETTLKKYLNDFGFEPYNFGPYSSEVFDTVQALTNAKLVQITYESSEGYLDEADRYAVEVQLDDPDRSRFGVQSGAEQTAEPMLVYNLTPQGVEVAKALYESLPPEEREELHSLKKRFNSIPLRKLIQYVYRQHPEYTTESVIKDSIL